ncbi:CheY-like chemotaxis protein [Hoeflea marina]|uniref:CheY-like chemotaxis protein n=1 Tax=Hoeflea marina TaxID=274592 RepID=A0A317PPW9_9HYPH|nr:response regulator [Hoeflea marina]PWW01978.1 CheY-like chemotaxis protein [Hoeflea marina]
MSVSVLLIEDNEKNLAAKKGYLETFGCGPILGVRDPDAAIHAARSLPHFDLVIADIDLSESSKRREEHNKGGVAVARWLRETNYPAFVAGYSSFFEGDEISESERSTFDDMVDRSVGREEQEAKFEDWIERAKRSDRTSTLRALLFEAYEGASREKKDYHVPVVSLDTLVDYDAEQLAEFRDSGFKLSLMLPTVDDEIRKAIPVWIKRAKNSCYIEVVGQPYLFADGTDELQAREALKSLIAGYYDDLRGRDPEKEMGSYVKFLFRFLDSLY